MARRGERPEVRFPGEGAVCVGYSGGLDSTVLLHVLHEAARAAGRELTAVHVHHGLSLHADAWAQGCVAACARLSVPIDVVRVAVARDSSLGLEAEARRARYAVYAARPEGFVALAHHRDDQAETLLLQLLRGTGLKGTAAMPQLRALNDRVTLWRPFLRYPRDLLRAHARELELRWIDDDSNAGSAQDRNYLRHHVAPALDARFPAWRDALARFASHAAEAQSLLEALARIDGAGGSTLALDAALPGERRANVLRAFLATHGLAMPSDARLREMARQLYEARDDASVRIAHDRAILTRFRGAARVDRAIEDIAPGTVPWHGESRIELGAQRGTVEFERAIGAGVAESRVGEGEWYLAARSGGERMRVAPGRPARTLKNLLQEEGIAPLDRERMPLLFHAGRLVWAPGIGIAAEYACEPGKPGVKPLWRVAGKSPLC